MERRQPFLHRVGEAGARFGTRPPRSRKVRLALQLGLAVLIFGFLVLTVIDQWSEIQNEGVHFHVAWLIPAVVILPLFYVFSALGWDFILRFLGHPIGFGRAQVAWGQPLLARYVPGSVLYVLGRVLLSERAGVLAPGDDRQHRLRTGDLGDLGDRRRRLLHRQPPRPAGRAGALGGAAVDPGGDRAAAPAGLRPARQQGAERLWARPAAVGGAAARSARADRLLLAELGRGRVRHLLRRPLGHLHPLQRPPPGRLGAGDRLFRCPGHARLPGRASAPATPPSPGR